MDSDTLEVECPVCDHKVPVEATSCPNCGAVFSLSGVDELQTLARELNDPVIADKPSAGGPPASSGPIADAAPKVDEGEAPKGKGGLLGKLFKKKR